MAPGIVYDGVGGAEGEGIFKGIKFWVAQRVPMRTTWIEHINSNGGSVVKLDKLADMIIADHKRKDAPAGSYSWKLIEESVKEGKLVDPESHLIGRPLGTSRPIGSSQPTKGTRTPFTKQDDDILVAWVMPFFRRGERTAGNEIFQQLEQKYPHHTFQSWRDRWVKKLRYVHETNAPISERAPGPAPTLASAPAPAPPPAAAAPRGPSRSHSPVKKPQSKIVTESRLKFTLEDDKLLILYIRERVGENGVGAHGNKVYQEFAEDFPHHSWHSWRDRYIRHLLPRLEDYESDEQESPLPTNRRTPEREARASKTPQPSKRPAAQSPASSTPAKFINPLQDTGSSPQEAPVVQSEEQQQPDGAVDAEADISTEDGQEEAGNDENEVSPPADPRTNKQQFFLDLKDFMEANENFINLWPQINSRVVDLFDMYQAVTADSAVPAHRNWEQIAETLGFDWIEDPSVLEKLQRCYETSLAEFELALQEFEENSEENEDDGSEEEQEDGEEADPSTAAMRSSPPIVTGLKRTMEIAMLSDSGFPSNSEGTSRKRSRLDKHGEIPSTPDEKVGLRRLQKSTVPLMSPLKHDIIASPELDSIRDSSQQLPPRTRVENQPPTAQETQWFDAHTQIQGEDDLFLDDQDEITPSQQLRSEVRSVSPIPYSTQRRGNILFSVIQGARSGETMSEKARGKLPMRVSEPLSRSRDVNSSSQNKMSTGQKAKRRTLPSSFGRPKPTPPPAQPKSITRFDDDDNDESMFVQDDDPVPEPVRPVQTAPHSLKTLRATSLPSAEPRRRNSPQLPPARKPSTAEQNNLEATIDHYVSMGYPEHVVIQALKAATMNLGLAGTAMEALMAGDGLPTHYEGIWTQRDDQSLELVDSAMDKRGELPEKELKKVRREWRRLEHKHGVERIEDRRKFLSMMDK